MDESCHTYEKVSPHAPSPPHTRNRVLPPSLACIESAPFGAKIPPFGLGDMMSITLFSPRCFFIFVIRAAPLFFFWPQYDKKKETRTYSAMMSITLFSPKWFLVFVIRAVPYCYAPHYRYFKKQNHIWRYDVDRVVLARIIFCFDGQEYDVRSFLFPPILGRMRAVFEVI